MNRMKYVSACYCAAFILKWSSDTSNSHGTIEISRHICFCVSFLVIDKKWKKNRTMWRLPSGVELVCGTGFHHYRCTLCQK